ncbi:MAG: hypothetical protein LQ345_004958 [Seirophora villosa]|nr:MAG: hypothetical protein LQ345_004958 [Seirophora villosa]
MALERALDFYQNCNMSPYMRVTIMTDSKYAHGCMTNWLAKWMNNGWLNCNGNEVANRDLIEQAVDLQDEIERNGNVDYVWLPRELNEEADAAVNEELDTIGSDGYSSPDVSVHNAGVTPAIALPD